MDGPTLRAYIDSRLGGQPQEEGDAELICRIDWLREPQQVNLQEFGIGQDDHIQGFNKDEWMAAPNVAFGGRTPNEIIKSGSDEERSALALAVDVIASLNEGAFS